MQNAESARLLQIKRSLKLPTQLAALLQLLMERDCVRVEDLGPLFSTLHGGRKYHNTGRMIVYRLRDRLEKMDIVVMSQYGEGYYLKPSDKSYLRGLLLS
jgi:hypothetical protein